MEVTDKPDAVEVFDGPATEQPATEQPADQRPPIPDFMGQVAAEPKLVRVRWSAAEGRLVPDDAPLLPEAMEGEDWVTWARVRDGVVVTKPVAYPSTADPNVYYEQIEDGITFYRCTIPEVDSWWLFDENTQIYSPPLPITDPPLLGEPPSASVDAASVEGIIGLIKGNPALGDALREALFGDQRPSAEERG